MLTKYQLMFISRMYIKLRALRKNDLFLGNDIDCKFMHVSSKWEVENAAIIEK